MRAVRILLVVLALAVIPSTAFAHPVHVRLGVGGHYWFTPRGRGLFDLTLAVDGVVAGPLYIGGRVGGALVTDFDRDIEPERAVIPIDLLIGLIFVRGQFYVEASGGPWIAINTGDALRGHVGLGVGFIKDLFWIGVEAGWLEPDAIIGLRLGLRFD